MAPAKGRTRQHVWLPDAPNPPKFPDHRWLARPAKRHYTFARRGFE
jgi:hypothetical protein